jgi:hypothetical protein
MVAENEFTWISRVFETGYCVTFAHGVASVELLTRMGGNPEEVAKLTLEQAAQRQAQLAWEQSVARAGVHQGWGFAVEDIGGHGADKGVLSRVSLGTQALALLRTADATCHFMYAEGGEIICSFDPYTPTVRRGTDPDRLLTWMEGLGLIPAGAEGPVSGSEVMFALAWEAFGAIVPREPVESGRLNSAVVGTQT